MICVMSLDSLSWTPRHTCTGLLQSIVEYQGINHGKTFDNWFDNEWYTDITGVHIKTYSYIVILRIILGLYQ